MSKYAFLLNMFTRGKIDCVYLGYAVGKGHITQFEKEMILGELNCTTECKVSYLNCRYKKGEYNVK